MSNRKIQGRGRPFVAIFGKNRISTIAEVRALVEEVMKLMNVPWYVTQHGIEHVKRVVEVLEILLLYFRLRPLHAAALIKAAWLHDIGQAMIKNGRLRHMGLADFDVRAEDTRKRHHIDGRDMVRALIASGWLQLNEFEQFAVPELVYRHNMYTELPRDKILRMLVILLRTADVLDVARQRVEHNDEGTPYDQVCDRIRKEQSLQDARRDLSHWQGHRAILSVDPFFSESFRGKEFHILLTVNKYPDACTHVGRLKEKMKGAEELFRNVTVDVATISA